MFFVHLAGHLGKDPETRFTPSGQKVTTFTLAVNHRKGKEDVTTWVRITIWGDRFDKLISYLKKGSAVIVGGKMNPPSSYTDKEGRTQFSLEVIAEMIEFSPFGKTEKQTETSGFDASSSYQTSSRNNTAQNSQYGSPYSNQTQYGSQTSGHGSSPQLMDEEELPF